MSNDKETTRRDFLTARGAFSHDKGDDEDQDCGEFALNRQWQSSFLSVFSKNAMACEFAIYLNADQYAQGPDTAMLAMELIDRLETKLTVYRSSSDVSRVNATAQHEPVAIDEELAELFATALTICEKTGGAFDFTAGPLSKLWGFHDRNPAVPSQKQIDESLSRIGSEHVSLERDDSTIFFDKPGIEIDLGGIGKGYALDRCCELFEQAGVKDFVIHGGKSSVIAMGNRTADSDSEECGWTVSVSHPLLPDTALGNIFLRNKALATSGSGRQSLFHQGRRLGHIIDPRTGWPPENVLSTTVLASTAAAADALATAFFVMGVDRTREYCAKQPDVGVIFVVSGERQSSVETTVIQVDESEWRPNSY